MNNVLTLPKLRRACTTCANDCYHCGARAETKEIDYKCWNCGKFSGRISVAKSIDLLC